MYVMNIFGKIVLLIIEHKYLDLVRGMMLQIWSSAQDYAVMFILLNMVESSFIQIIFNEYFIYCDRIHENILYLVESLQWALRIGFWIQVVIIGT